MGCGKSKHAVATASAPTAVARKKSSIKKSSGAGDSREEEMPMPPPKENSSNDSNVNAVAVEAKEEAEPGKLISRESPQFFSSHKDVERIAAIVSESKSDGGDSEYGSPRTESAGREDSMNKCSVRAEDGGEIAGEGASAAVVVVESEPPDTKQQLQNCDDR
ncbi:unnamed protein product [Linum trigynum]|uniref:Uncharacterized protein n=1 Tax=Linum trigynum TaxID=586398 RepID=A0AAV2FFQ8_9ROSI